METTPRSYTPGIRGSVAPMTPDTAEPGRIPRFIQSAQEAADLGAGAARVHASAASDYRPSAADGFEGQPVGVDVITDRTLIRRHFPSLADDTVALFHGRRCGWLSGQQLGMHMLERARDKGVRLMQGRVETIGTTGGRVSAVAVSGRTIPTPRVGDAAGAVPRAAPGRVGRPPA